jgi:hypothetical protein
VLQLGHTLARYYPYFGNDISKTILSQGAGQGQTQNIRLPVPGQAANMCKNMIDLHPLFIIEAGGTFDFCPWTFPQKKIFLKRSQLSKHCQD